MKLMRLACLLSFLSVPAYANESSAWVSCEDQVGSEICKALDAAAKSFEFTCTGDACYSLWRKQMDKMYRFVQLAEDYLPYSYQASEELGNLAWKLNDKLCRSSARGDARWMQAIFKAKVAARDAAKRVQENANISPVRSCSLSWHG